MPSKHMIWLSTIALAFVSVTAVSAQTSDASSPTVVSQPGSDVAPRVSESQPGDSNSLTIAPQPMAASVTPQSEEIPRANSYAPAESLNAGNRSYRQAEDEDLYAKALGVTVVYGQHVHDEVVASYCHAFNLSHRAPESFGPMRVVIRGLEVVSVMPGSSAALAGLRGRFVPDRPSPSKLISWLFPDRSVGTGDFIVAANGWAASSAEDLDRVIRNTALGGSILLTVVRSGYDDNEPEERSVTLRLPNDPGRPGIGH